MRRDHSDLVLRAAVFSVAVLVVGGIVLSIGFEVWKAVR